MLRETLRAVMGEGMVQEFEEIKKLHSKDSNALGIMQELEINVQNLKNDVDGLMHDVKIYMVYEKKLRNLALLESKEPWILYKDLQRQRKKSSENLSAAKKVWIEQVDKVAPKQSEVNTAKALFRNAQTAEKRSRSALKEAECAAKAEHDERAKLMGAHANCMNDIQAETVEQITDERRIGKILAVLKNYREDLKELMSKDNLKAKWELFKPGIKQARDALQEHNQKVKETERKIGDMTEDLNNCKRAIRKVSNPKDLRMQKLLAFAKQQHKNNIPARNAAAAARHVHQVKKRAARGTSRGGGGGSGGGGSGGGGAGSSSGGSSSGSSSGSSGSSGSSSSGSSGGGGGLLFGKVFGPLIVEAECRNPHYAEALENAIGRKWSFAFVFTDAQDYKMLKRENENIWGKITYAIVDESKIMPRKQVSAQRPFTREQLEALKRSYHSSGENLSFSFADKLLSRGEPAVLDVLRRKGRLHKQLIASGLPECEDSFFYIPPADGGSHSEPQQSGRSASKKAAWYHQCFHESHDIFSESGLVR